MVPDKFNMVDMGGIDLIMMQGEEVPGLYDRLVESIAQCGYQCLYNWLFDGIVIPPSYVKMEVNEDDEVAINEGITVSPDDVIHIYSVSPGPVEPEIIPLLVEENGVYTVPVGKDGFNPVTVDVPSYTPVIESKSITENGTYTATPGVDGYSPIVVNVPGTPAVVQPLIITQNGAYNPPTGVDGYAPVTVNVPGGIPDVPYINQTSEGTGYINGNTYYASQGYNNRRLVSYQLNANKYYVICRRTAESNRFRVARFLTDPLLSQTNITGVAVGTSDSQTSGVCFAFNTISDSTLIYLCADMGNNSSETPLVFELA